MLRVGIVGLGFMGRMHYRCWKAQPGAIVAAICEANPKVVESLNHASGGNVAGAADHVDLTGVSLFNQLDELIASGEVDTLSITLPTFLHPEPTISALNAGLHVLCEKPMALEPSDCDRMIAAAKSSGRVLQIGHCIRFWPEYVVARELVDSGRLGRPIAASFRRFSSMPTWSPDGWFADEKRSGGQPLDLHIHDTDFIHYLFGLPISVSSIADQSQSYISTQYRYSPEGPAVVAESTWRMAPSFGFEMSFTIVLERGTIVYDSTRVPAFRVCPADGEPFTPDIPAGDGYTRQVDHFTRAVQGEAVDSVVTPWQSRETVRLVLAEKQSARENRPIAL
jgi:predicted dehydrogenase